MYYYGITIGPIMSTIQLSTKPLGLWFSSFLFSEFSKSICKALKKGHGPSESFQLFVPCVDSDAERRKDTAVGKYHDRIIFESDKEIHCIQACIESAIENLQEKISDKSSRNIVDLNKYLVYQLACLNSENCADNINVIQLFSTILDSMELNTSLIPGSEVTKMRNLVSQNERLTSLKLFQDYSDSLQQELSLRLPDGGVKDLKIICRNETGHESSLDSIKSEKYYVILRADGDNVGGKLMQMTNKQVIACSKVLLSYGDEVAQKIKDYGGSLLYAGGDDLLAIVPLKQYGEDTILSLCKEVNQLFKRRLAAAGIGIQENDVSLSFGLGIFYYKFPLFEALGQSLKQLFGVAKSEKVGKNAVAIYAQKHSGQVIQMIVKQDWVENSEGIYDTLLSHLDTENNSVLYHLMNNANLFKFAIEKFLTNPESKIVDNLFTNYFDHLSQQDGDIQYNIGFIKSIIRYLQENPVVIEQIEQRKEGMTNQMKTDIVYDYIIQILRFRKLLVEGD